MYLAIITEIITTRMESITNIYQKICVISKVIISGKITNRKNKED